MAGHWPDCYLGNLTCFLQSNLDYSSSGNLEMPQSQESSSSSSVAPSSQDKRQEWDPLDSHRGGTSDTPWHGKDSYRVDPLPSATCQHREPQDERRPPSVPLLATEGLKGPPKGLGPRKTQVPQSMLSRPSKPSKVTQERVKILGSFEPRFPFLSDRLFLDKPPR